MKNKGHINFKAIGLALIFLFNPNIAVIDVLPDFIGYVFLCMAIVSLADLNETIASALAGFKRMIFVDGAKILALFWIFGMSVTNERNSSLLLWSFVFAVLEMVLALPAFIKLFSGLTELGYLYDNKWVVSAPRRAKRTYTEKISRLTAVFISAKAMLSFLPELSDLSTTEYSDNEGLLNLYRYIGIMRFLAFIPVLIIGVFWLIKVISYFNRLNSDTQFVGSLEDAYIKNVLPKTGIFAKRNLSVSFAILITALVFSYDFRLEYFNLLPDFVCGLLLIAFFATVSKQTDINKKPFMLISAAYAAVSFAAYIFEVRFFDEYYYGAINRSEEAMTAFVIMAVASCISILLFVLLSLCVLKTLKAVVHRHTGVVTVSEHNVMTHAGMSKSLHKELDKYLLICFIATLVYAASDIAYVLLAKDLEFMFFVNSVAAVIFIVSYVKAYFEISEAVTSRYILE